MKTLETNIRINATTEEVWAILMDIDKYNDWNPFITKMEGSTEEKGRLTAMIQPPGGKPMQFKPTVVKNEYRKEFRWLGHLFVKGLFDGEHYFKIRKIDANTTELIHGEKFSGVLSGIILNMIGKDTLSGFMAMNAAMKERVEATK